MKKLIFSFMFILSGLFLQAQNVSVLKDSVCLAADNCFELEELKFDAKNVKLYKIIQKSYSVLEGKIFENSEKRLKAKKDTLKKLISNNSLQESQYGFEKYTILFNKNNLINIAVGIQSYGSPWEDEKYYFFDAKSSVEIGNQLFISTKKLSDICRKKLKDEENKDFVIKDISQYRIDSDKNGKVSGITFIFDDNQSPTSSGYQKYEISFIWKELEKYIVPKYKKMLIQK